MINQCIICNIIAYSKPWFSKLGRRLGASEDCNIGHLRNDGMCTADAAKVYILSELEEIEAKSNAFSERLCLSIVRRLKERRNEYVVWLATFLANPDTILKDDKISGRKPIKNTCINLANKLTKRLISKDNEKEEDEEAKPVQKTTSAEVNERCFVGTAWARGPKITRS